jgi:hypothetical protein
MAKEKKLMNEYEIFGKRVLGHSPEQALGSLLIKERRPYDFEKYSSPIGRYVQLIREDVKSKKSKLVQKISDTNDMNVDLGTMKNALSWSLSEIEYNKNQEKYSGIVDVLPKNEEKVEKMNPEQVKAMYFQICLGLPKKR